MKYTDKELLDLCKEATLRGEYDQAIDFTEQMQNRVVATKAHLLVIERLVSNARKNGVIV